MNGKSIIIGRPKKPTDRSKIISVEQKFPKIRFKIQKNEEIILYKNDFPNSDLEPFHS